MTTTEAINQGRSEYNIKSVLTSLVGWLNYKHNCFAYLVEDGAVINPNTGNICDYALELDRDITELNNLIRLLIHKANLIPLLPYSDEILDTLTDNSEEGVIFEYDAQWSYLVDNELFFIHDLNNPLVQEEIEQGTIENYKGIYMRNDSWLLDEIKTNYDHYTYLDDDFCKNYQEYQSEELRGEAPNTPHKDYLTIEQCKEIIYSL